MTVQQYHFLEQIKSHYERKLKLETLISMYPEGSLVITKKGKYKSYYIQTSKNGVKTRKYLSQKRDSELIDALSKKQTFLPAIQEELVFQRVSIKSMKTYAKTILKKAIFPPIDNTPSFSQNTIEPKNLKYTTNRGEKVRSKSEKIIADLLYEYKVNYKYEKGLDLPGFRTLYPDFTIVSPLNNQTYYWEHNGLDTDDYLNYWKTKKQIYESSNINSNNCLVVTTEEDVDNFRNLIEQNFTLKRYNFIFRL